MFTFEQCADQIKELQVLLDTFHDLNDTKEVKKNKELQNYANSLRKACVALGEIRYSRLAQR